MDSLSLPVKKCNLDWTFKDGFYFHVEHSERQAMKRRQLQGKGIDWLKLEKNLAWASGRLC